MVGDLWIRSLHNFWIAFVFWLADTPKAESLTTNKQGESKRLSFFHESYLLSSALLWHKVRGMGLPLRTESSNNGLHIQL